MGLYSYSFMYWNAVKESSSMLDKNLLEIQNMLSDVEATSNGSSWIASKKDMTEEKLLEFTSKMIAVDTNIISCAIGYEAFRHDAAVNFYCPTAYFGNDGQMKSSIMGSDDYDYFGMDWFIIPKLLGKSWWSDPFFDSDGSGRLVSSYSTPLYDEDGEFLAVLRCDIDLEWLSGKIQELRPYENSFTVLAGRNASIISHRDKDMILSETLFSMAMSEKDADLRSIARSMVNGETGYGRYKDENGRGFIVYGQLNNGWSAGIICSNDDVLAETKKMNIISLLVAFVALILLYFSNKKIVEYESRPITAIAYSALSIAQGNFKARIPEVASKDELRRLHDSLHYLEDSIDKYISELRVTTSSNERYESELNIASAIQMQMLPKDYPHTDKVDLYAILHPAKEVGGDLYDFFVKDNILYFAVGDVSGKGVPAALYMAITRSAFRFIAGLGLPVDGIVSKINNAFCDGNDSGMFVTMFVGRINLDTLKMEYCNAGHNPIVIINPDGKSEFLHAKANMAAGLFEDFPYSGETVQLEKGSQLLIYTDGVTEAEDWDNQLYGEDRLKAFSERESMSLTSQQFIEGLGIEIKNFTKGCPQNDDITMMMIKL
ncbi:MAG: SpoIIE family protein phosphatase [Bacteroidales bacterium]|nr:SpoIIE family protein phosphatase [Bacteroidales bacterium]